VSLTQSGRSVTALAGGVGGAKLAQGLADAVSPESLSIIVNTADDFDLWGLRICPDLDTVLYTLAGIANPATGWGIEGDTHVTLDAITRYGEDPWFQLGDQDVATHVLRTRALRAGQSLTEITANFATRLGVLPRILPMTDDVVATMIHTPDAVLAFQDYFVRRRQSDTVTGVTLAGIDDAELSMAARSAISAADVIVFCPSNPIVSTGPILALPGVRDLIGSASAVRIGVSPIVGGKAIKGPADRMLQSLGHESSAFGVASIYAGLIDIFVIDTQDAADRERIEALGMRVVVTGTVMHDRLDRDRLAIEVLQAADAARECVA